MTESKSKIQEPQDSFQCEIWLEGQLADRWSDWFDGLTIILSDDGHTLLKGSVNDQAVLHGIFRKVRDLGLPLLSLSATKSNRPKLPLEEPDESSY